MFEINKNNLNGFEEFVIHNINTGDRCSIVPAFGVNIRELVLDNESIIDGYKTIERFYLNEGYKSSFLIPFPNRILNGEYLFDGNKYQLPKNDISNALHGFFFNKSTVLKKKIIQKSSASLTFSYQYDGTYTGYPFPFIVDIMITLNNEGFKCCIDILSQDKKMPIGVGWHPYFRFSDETVNNLLLKIPECKFIKADNEKIPNGELVPYSSFNKPKSLKGRYFDTGFLINSKKAVIELHSKEKQKIIKVEQNRSNNSNCFFQIYIPAERKSIAIEPMTCAANSFNNKIGLEILNKGERLSTLLKVSIIESRNKYS